jgi:hypothetical protein
VIAANTIAVTVAGSECGNSNCGQRAVDTRPLLQAGEITASANSHIGSDDVSLA